MCLLSTTSSIGKIGLLLSLVSVFILVSEVSAQCVCHPRKKAAHVQRAAPARAYAAKRVYVAPKAASTATRVYVINRGTPGGYNVPSGAYDADYYDTRRIAKDYGFRDGWEDGEDAGMERDKYHPENSGDYHKATNGYEDRFGSKSVYREAYRYAYLRGYNAGFRSIANRSSFRSN